jgi:hypothetical protein
MKPFRENRRGEKFKAGDTILVFKKRKSSEGGLGENRTIPPLLRSSKGGEYSYLTEKLRYKPFIEKMLGIWQAALLAHLRYFPIDRN